MSDIFISYTKEDRKTASNLSQAFEREGWTVWWDRKLLTGERWDEVIEHELEISLAVVVIWSQHSIKSSWVKNEARFAHQRGKLFPVSVKSIGPPLEFSHIQAQDLSGWNGDTAHGNFRGLAEAISSKTPPPRKPRVSSTAEKESVAVKELLLKVEKLHDKHRYSQALVVLKDITTRSDLTEVEGLKYHLYKGICLSKINKREEAIQEFMEVASKANF